MNANKSDPNKKREDSLTLVYENISGEVLEIIGKYNFNKSVEYLHYKARYMNTPKPIPDFKIPTHLGLEVLIASELLGIWILNILFFYLKIYLLDNFSSISCENKFKKNH